MDKNSTSIDEKLKNFAPHAELMPGVIIVHQLEPFGPVYMTPNGLKQLGIDMQELKGLGADYHQRFFNNVDMTDFLSKMKKLLENNKPGETFTFFQQVKLKEKKEWVWHITSLGIFLQDSSGKPTHTIAMAIPIDQMKHIPNKAERLLAENTFFNENKDKFLSLGDRAKEILRLVALGKSSSEIADELYISIETVNTHRKLIKQKLEISSVYEFTEYAQAFDLI